MTKVEMQSIYKYAVTSYDRKHDPAHYENWSAVLGGYIEREVKRALTIWQADDTQIPYGGDFRARGSIMPSPADVKSLVELGRRHERESSPKFIPCNQFQRNVDVNGMSWPELICSSGQLYLRTVCEGNAAVRSMRPCDCWERWKRERAA